ncbi:MAG TPA: hypothetical protein VFS43_34150, partial [Polyangiaceae bacterium]|nr:hypothetical protein [Polyangiaceae bacterium]
MKLRASLTAFRVSLSGAGLDGASPGGAGLDGASPGGAGLDGASPGGSDPEGQVGRPFRVEGVNRLAPLAARGDWSLPPAAAEGVDALPAPLRAELGAYWARLGQMEHASVAAFARFALHLLALGAPSELVAGA